MSSYQPQPRPGVQVVARDPWLRALLSAMLSQEGHIAHLAADANSALALLRRRVGELDAAVVELDLPGTDGLEAGAMLAAARPGLPCCLMGVGLGEATLPDGFAAALDLPFSLAGLKTCLDTLLPREAAGLGLWLRRRCFGAN